MHYSLVQHQNSKEIKKVRDYVDLSLQDDTEGVQNFNTINSINVPVNQEIAWELTRFKSKKRVYKNPNLSDIHLKSAIEEEKAKKKRKSRPNKFATEGVDLTLSF